MESRSVSWQLFSEIIMPLGYRSAKSFTNFLMSSMWGLEISLLCRVPKRINSRSLVLKAARYGNLTWPFRTRGRTFLKVGRLFKYFLVVILYFFKMCIINFTKRKEWNQA